MRVSRKNRIDTNQPEICAALKKIGASVVYLNSVGDGVPDILVGFGGKMKLLEIKMPGCDSNKDQIKFRETWNGGSVYTVDTISSAIDVVTR